MPAPLILYSTNTWLAFAIAERYYGGIHFAWCSPFFRPDAAVSSAAAPPTAIPGEIYDGFFEHVSRGDQHSPWIARNKIGILNGAEVKYASGVIDIPEWDNIKWTVEKAEIRDFRPLVFVIPFGGVEHLVEEVPPAERAHPLSVEYRIEELPRDRFDVIELRRG